MVLSDDVKKDKVKSAESDTTASIPVVSLHPSIERLVERLYAEAGQAVRKQLSGSLQTSAENPLGTLTLTQIEQGRKHLRDVQKLLTDKPKLKGSIHTDVIDLSNAFYSAIPQVMALRPRPAAGKEAMDSWLSSMALNNEKIIDDKEELLDLLSDVQGVVGGFATTDIGAKYQQIGCEYTPLDTKDTSYKNVEEYVQNTRSDRHSWKVGLKNIWRVNVKGQKDKHLPIMKNIGNIKPLFHGSRPANILGICKHGILIRPPGAVVSGAMYGLGAYFADQSSKSEQYSMGSFGSGSGHGDTYFMFVADVALGKIKEYEDAQQHLTKPPSGYDSVMGKKGYRLYHNEFIVYDVNQHLLQYLVEFSTR
jgi:poly [ADP-ribose] polymerase